MGILYENMGFNDWGIFLFVLFVLMAFNEFARSTKWGGIVLFMIVPTFLTIYIWPTTLGLGKDFGLQNIINIYLPIVASVGFMAIRYIPSLSKNRGVLFFPAFILALNILISSIEEFQKFNLAAWSGTNINNIWIMSGPWNIMNGIAGILNLLVICGWSGIIISKDKTQDMIWPDMIWPYVLSYSIWNFAYTYNCISDQSIYCGLALLLSSIIATAFIKKGAWLQHRMQTLALWTMFIMSVPSFVEKFASIATTHNSTALFVISLISLIANAELAIYQFIRVRKNRKNILSQEIYDNTKVYKNIVQENK